jgi:hypothetical protein
MNLSVTNQAWLESQAKTLGVSAEGLLNRIVTEVREGCGNPGGMDIKEWMGRSQKIANELRAGVGELQDLRETIETAVKVARLQIEGLEEDREENEEGRP